MPPGRRTWSSHSTRPAPGRPSWRRSTFGAGQQPSATCGIALLAPGQSPVPGKPRCPSMRAELLLLPRGGVEGVPVGLESPAVRRGVPGHMRTLQAGTDDSGRLCRAVITSAYSRCLTLTDQAAVQNPFPASTRRTWPGGSEPGQTVTRSGYSSRRSLRSCGVLGWLCAAPPTVSVPEGHGMILIESCVVLETRHIVLLI